jgi:hypothetical protein
MNIRRQRGVTAIGWIIILALIGFFSLITIKLLPVYSEYFSVSNSLDSVVKQDAISGKGKAAIVELVLRRFQINEVKSARRGHINVTKRSGHVEITVDYEVRKNLFGNLDIVVHFVKTAQG